MEDVQPMSVALCARSWHERFQSFAAKPSSRSGSACDSLAIALCDLAMEEKPSPKQLLEIALKRQAIDLELGPEDGPDAEIVIDRLIHAAWHLMTRPDYQVVRTDGTPFYFHSIDQNGKLVRVSEAWAHMLGYEPVEMLGRASVEFLTEASKLAAREDFLPQFYKDGFLHDAHYDFTAKDGHIVPVIMNAAAEIDNDGRVLRSLAVLTPRKTR